MNNKQLIIVLVLFISIQTYSQVYTNKVVGKKNEALKDSLKVADYPYSLPIWGEKATQKGYQLPYSAGISVNYFWQESSLVLNNLSVGFNNSQMVNLDQIVRFNESVAAADALNIRPDVWLFPFLNVYGILGKVQSSTNINASLWVPDGNNNWSEVISFKSGAKFDGTTMGIGFTPTIGIGGGWMALDMNVAWTDISALDKPAMTFVFGPRFGKTFKLKKPEQNIAVWAGGFRVHLKSETSGSLPLSEVIPIDGLQEKVDAGFIKVDEKQTSVNNWWDGLTVKEKTDPANIAKYNVANKALETADVFLTNLDGALSTPGNTTVQYSLDKAPKDMWNFIVGTQYQFNRHFMWRAEAGFLGSRKQFMTSIQYRFGL
jgi:hypothetical protein